MKISKMRVACFGLLISLFAQLAQAIVIQYQLTPLGANHYRYTYTVINDGSLGPGVAVQLFDILFDPVLYDEPTLTIVTPPPLSLQWTEAILPSGPGFAASYNALGSGGVTAGTSVSGFAVEFNWLGGGQPGAQPFEIYDPITFALLATGTTSPAPSGGGATAPALSGSGLVILAVFLAMIGFMASRRKSVS